MDFEIVLATEDDLEAIGQLIYNRCVWFEEKNLVGWRVKSYTKAFDCAYFQKQMQIYKLFVAKKDAKVCGVMLLKTEDLPYWEDKEISYFLHHLTTDITVKGAGKALIQHALAQCRKDEKQFLRLDCFADSTFLNTYYKNAGFCFAGSGHNGTYHYNRWEYPITHKED